ncbi:MAG: hypothetical protein ABIR32_21585 [Ilumatobacteraceae bacterium]
MEEFVRRIVDALPTATGKVLIRDRAGHGSLAESVAQACAARGLAPITEYVSNAELRRVIGASSPGQLSCWDVERAGLAAEIGGLIVLGGWRLDLAGLAPESVAAWAAATGRVEAVIERRRVPTVVVAVPTEDVASQLGMSIESLESRVMPSILVSASELNLATDRVVTLLDRGSSIEVRTAVGTLAVERGQRPLLVDDGVVDSFDIAVGATVSNLPAGSVYWTVLEDSTRGRVELVNGAVLEFGPDGRVTSDEFAGERVSHIGIATNPLVSRSIGWTIVDEHRPGAVFLALGENRYLGGENASAINVDLLPSSPTVVIDGTTVVADGELV